MSATTNQNQGCLAPLLKLFGITNRTKPVRKSNPFTEKKPDDFSDSNQDPLPYRIRDDFLSPAEKSFYYVVKSVVGGRAVICPKVNLADIFFVVRPKVNRAYRGRIAQKHLDFLLCDPKTMRPLIGIELDDTSHRLPQRRSRDKFVDRVFQAAGLPLMRIAVRSSYNARDLSTRLESYLGEAADKPVAVPTQTPPQENVEAGHSAIPFCLKCGEPMVRRTVARGQHQGKQFWGCPNYPRCREVRPLGKG